MDNNFLIISDEIYEKIIYDKKHYSPAKYSDNVITLNGFSKTSDSYLKEIANGNSVDKIFFRDKTHRQPAVMVTLKNG